MWLVVQRLVQVHIDVDSVRRVSSLPGVCQHQHGAPYRGYVNPPCIDTVPALHCLLPCTASQGLRVRVGMHRWGGLGSAVYVRHTPCSQLHAVVCL
jgi:hypothetical protein